MLDFKITNENSKVSMRYKRKCDCRVWVNNYFLLHLPPYLILFILGLQRMHQYQNSVGCHIRTYWRLRS